VGKIHIVIDGTVVIMTDVREVLGEGFKSRI